MYIYTYTFVVRTLLVASNAPRSMLVRGRGRAIALAAKICGVPKKAFQH